MASQFKELVDTIAQREGQQVASRFSEEDLKKLWENGYQAAVDLQRATRESLLEIGLPRARVDALTGTSVAGGLPLEPRDQIAAALQKKLPPPSSYAKNNPSSGWSDSKLAHLLPYMGMHRPGTLPGTQFEQLPVSLLDPVLAKIEEDCAYGEPTQIDVGAARQLMTEMSGSFADEAARLATFRRWAAVHLGLHFERVTFRGCETDGSALISTSHFNALGSNLEVKLDIGSGGGDPHVQNTAYAALANSDEARKEVRRFSRCPALLLQLAGPNLSLSGFAFGEALFCDQLSHTVCLLWQPGSELLVGAARLILAARTGWQRLQEFYINLGADFTRWSQSTLAQRDLFEQPFPKSYPDLFTRPLPLLQLEYPYPRSYGDPPTGFTYVERLSRLTFLAKSMSGSQIVVKFCKR